MNYFLIANNNLIKNETIEGLPISEEDVIILYNKQMPLKWKKIKEHKNKILFLRSKGNGYHGENFLPKNKDLYKEIILLNRQEEKKIDYYKNKYKIEFKIYSYSEDINKINIFPFDKSPQSGLISYIYIINNLEYNKIYLIGFTNIDSRLWRKHSKDIEQDFYKNELEKGFIIKIDS